MSTSPIQIQAALRARADKFRTDRDQMGAFAKCASTSLARGPSGILSRESAR